MHSQESLPFFYLAIPDRTTLGEIYMPFVKNGGLFIPTSGNYALGESVFLALRLLDEETRHPACATVIWITPEKAQRGRAKGIGVRFNDPDNKLKNRITSCLSRPA